MRRLEADGITVQVDSSLGIFTASASDGVTSACVRYARRRYLPPPGERQTTLDNRMRNETVLTLRRD